MGNDNMHNAMRSVLEDMGRAAREGRARRFTGRPAKKGTVDVTIGDVELKPEPQGMPDEDLRDLETQR